MQGAESVCCGILDFTTGYEIAGVSFHTGCPNSSELEEPMSKARSLSEILCEWAAAVRYEDLPQAVVHHVKRSLLDYLGVTIKGATFEIARVLQDYIAVAEGVGRASVIGTDHMFSASNATLANGTAAAVIEMDDGHARVPIHFGATCIPAILAMAQARCTPVRDVICAIAVAYEISSRIGNAIFPAASDRGFHCAPVVGVFGATIGVAKILGSDSRTMSHALGTAGSYTGGLFDYHSGWLDAWCLNCGRAGREGLLCATLADQGVSGPIDILDGPRGFAPAFTGEKFNRESLVREISQEWQMLGSYMKLYPCCRHLHSAIDAVLSLRAQLAADVYEVDRIIVETTEAAARLNYKTFDSTSEAKMSMPYAVAVAFTFGTPMLEHFEEAIRSDPRILYILDRVQVRKTDDPLISTSERRSARVSISVGGTTLDATVLEPSGDPGKPLSDKEVEDKFRRLSEPMIGRSKAEHVITAIWNMNNQEGGARSGLDFLNLCAYSASCGIQPKNCR